MSINIRHDTNDISTNTGTKVTSGGNTVITTVDTATDTTSGIVELATTAEIQTGTDTLRVPSVSSLRNGLIVQRTAVASTSGTSISFSSIPSWAKRIIVLFSGVSLSGTSHLLVQIGTGTVTTTGYVSTSCAVSSGAANTTTGTTSTNGFVLFDGVAAATISGTMTLQNISGNTWVENHCAGGSADARVGGGNVTLAGVLDILGITTVNGTDTFDAGSINIIYE